MIARTTAATTSAEGRTPRTRRTWDCGCGIRGNATCRPYLRRSPRHQFLDFRFGDRHVREATHRQTAIVLAPAPTHRAVVAGAVVCGPRLDLDHAPPRRCAWQSRTRRGHRGNRQPRPALA